MDGSFIDVDSLRIFHVESGAGQPVLYVHGNTGSCLWFERVMDVPGCRTVALDMPNFGRSSPLAGAVSIDAYADSVVGFIRALGLQRPLLVAHSFGGAVAISLAVRHPDLIRGLLLVDSAAPSGLVTPEERHPAIEAMRMNRQILSAGLGAVVPTLKDPSFLDELVDDAALMAPPAWIGNARALSSFDYRGRCTVFTGPVLVVWGRKDVIVTEEMARETAAAFPRGRLEIRESVGHSIMVEDPGAFVGMVSGFVGIVAREK